MDLNEYQKEAQQFARASKPHSGLEAAFGLLEEAGEVAGEYKRYFRDDNKEGADEILNMALLHELGDVLWYIARIAHLEGFSLEDIALANLEKLHERKAKGTIQGRGGNR